VATRIIAATNIDLAQAVRTGKINRGKLRYRMERLGINTLENVPV